MTTNSCGEPVFQLGKFYFRLSSQDKELLGLVSKMFEPACENSFLPELVDLDQLKRLHGSLPADACLDMFIDHIIDLSHSRHPNMIYLDAAVLINSNNAACLIAGRSYSGKTTSTLSLCLSQGWKLLSEDISYLEFPGGRFCPVIAPLSIREPTWELIERDFAVKPMPLVANRWLSPHGLFCDKRSVRLKDIRSLFILSETSPNEPQTKLSGESISANIALRKLLPLSNLLREPAFIPIFAKELGNCPCFFLSGGSLKERVEFIDSTKQDQHQSASNNM